jgi:hypothetical protein
MRPCHDHVVQLRAPVEHLCAAFRVRRAAKSAAAGEARPPARAGCSAHHLGIIVRLLLPPCSRTEAPAAQRRGAHVRRARRQLAVHGAPHRVKPRARAAAPHALGTPGASGVFVPRARARRAAAASARLLWVPTQRRLALGRSANSGRRLLLSSAARGVRGGSG